MKLLETGELCPGYVDLGRGSIACQLFGRRMDDPELSWEILWHFCCYCSSHCYYSHCVCSVWNCPPPIYC